MLWLYLDFPSLQLDSFLADNDISADTAVVIVDEKTNEIIQLNKTAINAGVQLKMGLASSAVLCHNLQVLCYQRHIEENLLKQIAQELYQVSADIAFYQQNGLFIKVGNMLRLYDSIEQYWQKITDKLQVFNISYCGATAYSAYAAQILARAKVQLISSDINLIDQHLKILTVSALVLPEKFISALPKLGIKTIRQWLAIPFAEFASRFTPEESEYFALVKGLQIPKFSFYQPEIAFTYELELLYEIKTSEVLLHPLTKIFQRLEHFLQQKNLVTQELLLTFSSRESASFQLTIASVVGEYKTKKWLELTKLQLEKIQLSFPITIINIDVKQFQNFQGEINDLLNGKKGQLTHGELISMLFNRLGKKQIFTLKLLNEHCPEKASVYQSVDVNVSDKNTEISGYLPSIRPSFLLPSPEQLTLPVDVLYGPERIQHGWWQEQEVVRDYFIAKNRQGQWCWIYRQPDKRWFLHGFFA